MLEIKPEASEEQGVHGPTDGDTTDARAEAIPSASAVAPNYAYWREHGGSWADEYDARKRGQTYYHLQELMLTDYIARCAPAKVLEFGCGPGRHLRNLSKLPGIDVYGYDQSAAMVSGCQRWASTEWIAEHVRVGSPTGRLPFEDGAFDVVYTAEVLLHVRPEDLIGRLEELLRVARGHVVHLETSPTYPLVDSDHDGCWHHDLVGAYAKLGRTCEVLPSGYSCHTPFRVALAEAGPQPAWSPVILSMYRRMERDLAAGIVEKDAYAAGLATQRDAAAREQGRAAEVARARIAELELELERRVHALREAEGQIAAQMAAHVAALSARPTAEQVRELQEQLTASRAQLAAVAGELEELRASPKVGELEAALAASRAEAAHDAEEFARREQTLRARESAWRDEASHLAAQRDRVQQRVHALLQSNERLIQRLHAALRGEALS